jgi:DNA-binding response OmpR family regulator
MKQRILVVHDDHVVADTLKLIFELNGYDSEAVYTPAQGIDNARTFAPNLILFDASIPVISCLDATASDLPAQALSARDPPLRSTQPSSLCLNSIRSPECSRARGVL